MGTVLQWGLIIIGGLICLICGCTFFIASIEWCCWRWHRNEVNSGLAENRVRQLAIDQEQYQIAMVYWNAQGASQLATPWKPPVETENVELSTDQPGSIV